MGATCTEPAEVLFTSLNSIYLILRTKLNTLF